MISVKVEAVWADCQALREEAQALRYRVFIEELCSSCDPKYQKKALLESDRYDEYCEHLLLRTTATDSLPARTIATYRILSPEAARQAGSYYSEQLFVLPTALRSMPGLIELGRACVDKQWRGGVAILRLWSAIAAYMTRTKAKALIGCVSIPVKNNFCEALYVWQALAPLMPRSMDIFAHPRHPLVTKSKLVKKKYNLPSLLRGYLKCGGQPISDPAYDAVFNTADFLLYCPIENMNSRYISRFFK